MTEINETNDLNGMKIENLNVRKDGELFYTSIFLSKKKENGKETLIQISMKSEIDFRIHNFNGKQSVDVILKSVPHKVPDAESDVVAKITYYPKETNDFKKIIENIE